MRQKIAALRAFKKAMSALIGADMMGHAIYTEFTYDKTGVKVIRGVVGHGNRFAPYSICQFIQYGRDEASSYIDPISSGDARQLIRLRIAEKYNVSPDYLSRAWSQWTK